MLGIQELKEELKFTKTKVECPIKLPRKNGTAENGF